MFITAMASRKKVETKVPIRPPISFNRSRCDPRASAAPAIAATASSSTVE